MRLAAVLLATLLAASSARAQAPGDTARKSALQAGIASYFLPGIGSYYAGHNQHAAVHGAIAAVLLTGGLIARGGRGCDFGCGGSVETTLFFAYIGNTVWAIVTAVRDVNAHNARVEGVRRSSFDAAPSLRIVAPPYGDAGSWRAEVHVLRVAF